MSQPLNRHEGGRCSCCRSGKGKVRYSAVDGSELCPWCAQDRGLISKDRLQVDAFEEMFLHAGILKGSPGQQPLKGFSSKLTQENRSWPDGPS